MGAILYIILCSFAYFSNVDADGRSITVYNRNSGNTRSCLIHAAQAVLGCCDIPMLINLRELQKYSDQYDKILSELNKATTITANKIISAETRKKVVKAKVITTTTTKSKKKTRQKTTSKSPSTPSNKKRRVRSDGPPSVPAGFRKPWPLFQYFLNKLWSSKNGEVIAQNILNDLYPSIPDYWVNLINSSVKECSEEVAALNKTYIPKPPYGIPFTPLEPKLFCACLFQKLITDCPVEARLNSFDEGECKVTVDSVSVCDPYLVPEDCYGSLFW